MKTSVQWRKKTVTVKSVARVKNIPADSTKDHALYVLFQKRLQVFIFPKGFLSLCVCLRETSKQFSRLSFCVQDKCKAGITD